MSGQGYVWQDGSGPPMSDTPAVVDGHIVVQRVYKGNSRREYHGPIVIGQIYRVEQDYYPDNRRMVEARRVHTEYHRRRR